MPCGAEFYFRIKMNVERPTSNEKQILIKHSMLKVRCSTFNFSVTLHYASTAWTQETEKTSPPDLSVPLLRERGGILLGLPLRFPDLPRVPQWKRLGNDLQRHNLDLSGLRCGPWVLKVLIFFLQNSFSYNFYRNCLTCPGLWIQWGPRVS